MSGAPDTPGAIPAELIAEARADQAPVAPGVPAPIPAAPVNWTAEGRELIDFALAFLVPVFPSLGAVYPDATRAQLGLHVGRVLEKYGLDSAALFGRWAPEIGLAMCAAPLIAPTVAAIRADRAARQAPADQPAAAPAAAPAPAAPLAPVTGAELKADNPLARFPNAAQEATGAAIPASA